MFEMFWLDLCDKTGVAVKAEDLNSRKLSINMMDSIIKALSN
jgi:hypothetical protein